MTKALEMTDGLSPHDSILDFESRLINKIEEEIISHFVDKGYVSNNKVISIEGDNYIVSIYYNPLGRILNIDIRSSNMKMKVVGHILEINSYGRINSIHFKIPSKILRINKKMINSVVDIVERSYVALKHDFILSYSKNYSGLYDILQLTINKNLEVNGYSSLQNRIVPVISKKDEFTFNYVVSNSVVNDLLDHFVKLKDPFYSPIELTASFCIDEEGHTVNQINKNYREGDLMLLDTSDFVSFSSNHKFFIAEAGFLDFGTLCEYNIAETKKHALQVGIPRSILSETKPIIENCKDELAIIFQNNEKKYISFLNRWKKVDLSGGNVAFEAGNFVGGLVHGIGNAILKSGI